MKRSNINIWILIIVMFLISLNSQARIVFDYLTIEQGLSQNYVGCILKDSRGFMWFGSWDGLNRYDGYDIKIYKNNPHDSTSLSHNFTNAICEDSYGNLWVGNEKGVCIYIYEQDEFLSLKLDLGTVNVILKDDLNRIWVGSVNGIEIFNVDGENGEYSIISDSILQENKEETGEVFAFTLDNDHKIWMGSANGVRFYDKNNKKLVKVLTGVGSPDDLFNNRILTLYADSRGDLWGGANFGLIRYNIENKSTELYFTVPGVSRTLSHNTVQSITEDTKGQLIVGTYGGLSIFNHELNDFTNYTERDEGSEALNNSFVKCVYASEDGNVWIGTERGGVNKYNNNQKQFENITFSKNNVNGLSYQRVNAVFEDDVNLWVGTGGGGLNIINKKSGEFSYLKHDPLQEGTILNNFISVIHKDLHGDMWVGCWGGGLNKLISPKVKNGNFKTYLNSQGDDHSIISTFISSIADDISGRLWVGTLDGLDMKLPNEDKFIHVKTNLDVPLTQVGCLKFDKQGNLWVGTMNGLFFIKSGKNGLIDFNNVESQFFRNDPDDKYSLSGNYIISILEDKDGQMWFGTFGRGVSLLKGFGEDGEPDFLRFRTEDGLANNIVYAIEDDKNGNLWLSTAFGLSKLNISDTSFNNFYEKDGIVGNEFYWAAGYENAAGKIYFGGTKGVCGFYPDSITINKTEPNLRFTDLKIYNTSIEVGEKYSGQKILNSSISNTDKLVFSHKTKEFSIAFSALHYDYPDKIRYKYILEGWDDKWKEADSRHRLVSYSNLSGGEYTFKVLATNNDGIWSETPVVIGISVIPPIWERVWFRIFIIILFISAVFAIYLSRITILKEQTKRLEQVVQERTSELKRQNEKLYQKTTELNERQLLVEKQSEELRIQSENLSDRNKALEESNNTKDKLFSIVSHDLKNPFGNLMGFCELLLERYDIMDDEKRKGILDIILKSSQKIYKLLENMLHWSRSQLGALEFSPELIDLKEMVEENVQLVNSMLDKKNIMLKVNMPDNAEAYADKDLINTVLRNLITNSIKYTQDGEVTVSGVDLKDRFQIEVHDNGLGIPSDKLSKLFNAYKSKSIEGTQGELGTGLGLIICKEFIDINGGEIYAKSEVGKGSTFGFILPKFKSTLS